MPAQHSYSLQTRWTGNTGQGTNNYRSYHRSHTISVAGKPDLHGSSDAAFRGDKTKHTPEDLLVASLSACHMLWYLHLCTEAGVVVVAYADNGTGTMTETEEGGYFTEVTLRPEVTVTEPAMADKANDLHAKANKHCFIARSVNFPVYHEPVCKVYKTSYY